MAEEADAPCPLSCALCPIPHSGRFAPPASAAQPLAGQGERRRGQPTRDKLNPELVAQQAGLAGPDDPAARRAGIAGKCEPDDIAAGYTGLPAATDAGPALG